MGYLLKEALKTLCGVNKWSYAVFWKIGEQNPKLLIWEECYYERIMYSGLQPISVASNEWETCLLSGEGDKVDLLVNKMMIDNHINIVGEGLVGRAAFTGNHQWILSGNYTRELHPPEVLNEVRQQFAAGMQTVAVVPVLPHGVIQLGSSLAIMENLGFVNDVKSLILQLGRLPGVLLSDSYATREHSPKMVLPSCQGKSFTDNTNQQIKSTQVSGFVGQTSYSMLKQIQNSLQSTNPTAQAPNVAHGLVKPHNSHYEEKVVSGMNMNMNVPSGSQIENGLTKAEVILPLYQQAWLNHQQQRQQHTLSVTGYGHDQQPYTGVRNHIGFMMPQNITNRGINSSSDKNSVTPPFGESSDLCNGLTSHLRSISDPYSMSDENKLAGNGFSVGGVQISDSSKTVTSSSHLADNLRTNHLPSGTSGHRLLPLDGSGAQIDLINGKETSENDLFQALCNGLPQPDEHLRSSEQIPGFIHNKQHEYGMQNSLKNSLYEDVPSSGNDLFDILGVDFKNKLLNDSWNNFVDNGPHQDLDKNNLLIKAASARSDVYSASEGTSDSGIFSVNGSDHLLDAVVSRAHFSAKPSLEDSVSCRTTLTNISSSTSFPSSLPPYKPDVSDQMHGDLYGVPKTLAKAGVVDSCLFRTGPSKEHSGNVSQCSSVYGSQISSRLERSPEIKQSCSVSTAYSKKSEEVGKSGRKRLKPGENPRPRPKDRQMIQDRVKELREIIPNGAKCSIDALLERTVKHMLFLQSVTKHADKLKQTGESKIISKEGGLLLKDNFEGGATWAYEVGSQSMVCPIIVEDLNPPRQLLVEILCEDRGLFLEIADMVRGLGLTILKGAMETQNDKIWARFAVEANRDVTRMEIFISLVRLLDQTVKSSAASSSGMMLHQHCQANVSIPATGGSL